MPFSAKALTSLSVVSCAPPAPGTKSAAARARDERRRGRAAIHGRRFSRRCRTGARGGLPTLPRPRVGGQGVCLEPAGGGVCARAVSLSGASSSRRSRRGSCARARRDRPGPWLRRHGPARRSGSPGGRCRERRRAPSACRRGRRRPTRLARPEPARRGRAPRSVSSRTRWRDRVESLVAASGNDCIASPARAQLAVVARLEDLPPHFGAARRVRIRLRPGRRWRRPRGSRR